VGERGMGFYRERLRELGSALSEQRRELEELRRELRELKAGRGAR
jgi:uncharacterized coiled-coil protein SlyX